MKAIAYTLQCGHGNLISRSLLCILFVLLINITLMVPSLSQSLQIDPDLNSTLVQHCNLCNAESNELKIMSLHGEQYTNQVTEIQNILTDLGFSLQEVEDWHEECIPKLSKYIETIRVHATKPKDKDLTAGSDQDIIYIDIFPNNSMRDLYLEKADPIYNPLEFLEKANLNSDMLLFGYFKAKYVNLGNGIVGVAAARRWNVYNEIAIPPENYTYPVGYAEAYFACGNLRFVVHHMKVASYPWKDYPGNPDKDQDMMGNDSLKPAEEMAQKIALELHDKNLCQLKPNIILQARAIGYTSAKKELEDSQNLKEITISGKVLDNTTGKPIKGARVEIVSGANNTSTTTSADGTYSIVAVKREGQGSETKKKIDFELRPLQYIVGVIDVTPP